MTERILNFTVSQGDPLNKVIRVISSAGALAVPLRVPCTPGHLAATLRAIAESLDVEVEDRPAESDVCSRCGSVTVGKVCPRCGGG